MPTRLPTRPVDVLAHRIDEADDLMTRDDRQPRLGQLTIDDMEIGAADRAGLDAHENFVRARNGCWPFLRRQRLPDPMQHHRSHALTFTSQDHMSQD